MERMHWMTGTALIALASVAAAQPSPEVNTAPTDKAIVVPPKMDSEAVATPPKNVDPGINAATPSVDSKNRQQTEEKSAKKRGTRKPKSNGN
jgi:hypothetical protein